MRARHLGFVIIAMLILGTIPLWADPVPEARGQVTRDIMMRDALSFEPNSFSAAPGDTVNLTIINAGSDIHTFTLFAQANAMVPTGDFNELQTYFNDNANIRHISLGGGAQQSISFTAPTAAGTYTFVCMEPGHSAGGMHGIMTVTSTPGEEPALDPLLIGVVAAIVVIVIAVTAVFILRRRR